MKTQEVTKKQTVQGAKVVLPQNSAKAQELLNPTKTNTVVALATTNEDAAKTEEKEVAPKVAKVRTESMENLAMRLRKEKASEEAILSSFIQAYKVKGTQDIAFIKPRVTIYMKIADKAIAATTKAK